jgi:NADPH-dependent glutamate synthase beta subunit-like oxidoreductase
MREIGVDIRCGVEVGKDVTIAQLRDQGYKAFYIAIGCQGGRKAGVPGEDADGVMTGVDFLREVGGNENYRLPGKTVVVGGGNVAIDVARCAVRCGSSEVSMCCLETRDIMPASPEEIAEAEAEDIKISCGWGPKEVVVRNGKVAGITFKKCVSVKDPDGRFNPKYDESDTMTIECDHVLLSIGQSIVWGNLLDGTKVELGRGKGAVADKVTYQTAEKDIFTGGDVYTGPKFVIDAIAAGKEGALSIHKFVHEGNSLVIGRNLRQFIELDKDNIDVPQYDNTARQVPGTDTSVDQKKSFRDVRKPFTEEQVRRETSRCLGCGASVVDPNRCVGCGVCTTKCGFDAIHLKRVHPEASRMTKSEDKMKAILPYMLKRAVKITFSGKKNK